MHAWCEHSAGSAVRHLQRSPRQLHGQQHCTAAASAVLALGGGRAPDDADRAGSKVMVGALQLSAGSVSEGQGSRPPTSVPLADV